MAWEKRGGRQYLYRTYRDEHGRCRRQYLGRGAKAQAASAQADQARAASRQDRQRLRAAENAHSAMDAQLAELDQGVRVLLDTELVLAGFYDHAGVWRKKGDARR
jgi:hypothetical protein